MSNDKHQGGRWSKRFEMWLLQLFAGRQQGLPLLKPEQLHRVLIVRYDRIGDMVITSPLIEALHTLAPHAEIDVLASPGNAVLPECDYRISGVFLWNRSLWDRIRMIRMLRKRRYDVVFQTILGRTSLPAALCSLIAGKGGRTVGRREQHTLKLLNHSIEVGVRNHFVERTFRLIHGIDVQAELPMPPCSVIIPDEDMLYAQTVLTGLGVTTSGYAVLNISASAPDKELSHEQNTAIARQLLSRNLQVVVMGLPSAEERAARIVAELSGKIVSFGSSSLMQASALVSRAGLLASPDTGIIHIAAAHGVPQLVIYPSYGDPEGWHPYGVTARIIQASVGTTAIEIPVDQLMYELNSLMEPGDR